MNRYIILTIVIMLTMITNIVNAECRMCAMEALKGCDLSGNTNIFLEELQNQGGSGSGHPYWNNNGWSLSYYLDGDKLIDYIFRDSLQAFGSDIYDSVQTAIDSERTQLIFGHVRRATSVSDIPNPHPFIFHTENADYAFMHNGTVNSSDFENRINELDDNWLTLHPITYYDNKTVDSEYLFSWIMLNIHLNDYNIFNGLIDAIQGMAATQSTEARTFILTDGIDLYCYKDGRDGEAVDHNLFYNWMACYGVNPFWVVMSLFPNNFNNIVPMVNDELLYLSPTGVKVSIRNCSGQNAIIRHNRQLHAGWNWESFPIFPTNTNNGADILDYLETNGGITEAEGYFIGNPVYDSNIEQWNPSTFLFNDNSLYKLNLTTDTVPVHNENCFNTIGILRDTNLPLIEDVESFQEYWIGYDIMISQRIDEAFGDNWSNVHTIKGEDWAYYRGYEYYDPTLPSPRGSLFSPENKYLEFGKGYIVTFYNDFSSFNWSYRHNGVFDVPHKKKPETFTYETKASYLPIDILENEVQNNNIEIGAFQDGKCIGAIGVIDYPVQLLAYSDPFGGEITFEINTGDRTNLIMNNYQIVDIKTDNTVEGSISPQGLEFAVIRLIKCKNTEHPSSDNFKINWYPNPFYKSVSLSFSLSGEKNIEISIYNLKGQKIKTLFVGKANAGNHEVVWNGTDNNGKKLAEGIYLYRLQTPDKTMNSKFILLR